MTPEERRAYSRDWYAKNKERTREKNNARARANYDPVRAAEMRAKKRDKLKAYRVANRDREIARARAWYASNRDRVRDSARLKRFGITQSAFDELLDKQNGACAICGDSFANLPSRHLHVDHCHATGLVRGLLCHHCNVAIGCLDDSVEKLNRAAAYLEAQR